MKFEDLLIEYEQKIAYVKRMTTPDTLSFYCKTKDYWEGYLKSTFDWFQHMKMECEDYHPMMRKTTDTDILTYKYSTLEENGDVINWPLCGVLEYRGQDIPIYMDDYGQQMFAVYKNQEIGGGSYNTCPEYDFCYTIDEIMDKI